jgi:hypothetical protein
LTEVHRSLFIRLAGLQKFFARKERALGESQGLIEFSGRDRVQAQRRAIDWWFTHRRALGLCLRDFFSRCRVSDDKRTITFIHPETS